MEGKSGTKLAGKQRSGMDRLDAITASVARSDEFMARVKDAEGDTIRLSDLMAEAIAMDREARGLERVGRDGRVNFCMERLSACHCLDAAREAYLKARGSNAAPSQPQSTNGHEMKPVWIYEKGTEREIRFNTREEFDEWNKQWGDEAVAFLYDAETGESVERELP